MDYTTDDYQKATDVYKQLCGLFSADKKYEDVQKIFNPYQLHTFFYSDFFTLQNKWKMGILTPQYVLDHYPSLTGASTTV
jgi:hypothetical protein